MNQVTTLEKVSKAMTASNLQVKEHVGPVDYIIATGMIAQRQPEASKFITFNATHSRESYKDVRQATIQIATRLNVNRGWNKTPEELKRIADVAVKMYLVPKCDKCHGRKYEPRADAAQLLSTKVCHKCKGTGNRAYPTKDESNIRDVVEVIMSIVDLAERSIRRKTSRY